ncbi:hypothetical protein Q2K19_22215 [Micromonospora soli]|uniref:hypothetical protein n=1 Tax=Micromonospora sp. NBRC 110009 TaxID=3061627 RepID=UPI002673263A|nr:hypothetical protein [Micromonospora sp. NBRC 110009]WKT96890.1 hypothetical protein Q2K19_22215 [Micromonospora sp. NBRC 110009]
MHHDGAGRDHSDGYPTAAQPEQIIRKLREGEKLIGQGGALPEVCSSWSRLKDLERENARLKKIVADQLLDIDMLKELNRGKW